MLESTNWRTLVKIFQAEEFVVAREYPDKIAMTRMDKPLPLTFQKVDRVAPHIILSCLRIAGISRDHYHHLLNRHRSH